jgi:hypothetical protein
MGNHVIEWVSTKHAKSKFVLYLYWHTCMNIQQYGLFCFVG